MNPLPKCSYCLDANSTLSLECSHSLCNDCIILLERSNLKTCLMEKCIQKNSYCTAHNSNYTHVCLSDNEPLCKRCLKFHQDHELISINELDNSIQYELSSQIPSPSTAKTIESLIITHTKLNSIFNNLQAKIDKFSTEASAEICKKEIILSLSSQAFPKPKLEKLTNFTLSQKISALTAMKSSKIDIPQKISYLDSVYNTLKTLNIK